MSNSLWLRFEAAKQKYPKSTMGDLVSLNLFTLPEVQQLLSDWKDSPTTNTESNDLALGFVLGIAL